MERVKHILEELRNVRDWRLSTKIMLLLLVGALASIAVIARQNEQRSTEVLTNAQSKLLTSLATSVGIQVDSQVLQYRRDATQVATDPEVVQFMSAGEQEQGATGGALLRRLAPVLAADPDYRLLLILDPTGRAAISNEPGVQGQDYSDREFFRQGKVAASGDPYISTSSSPRTTVPRSSTSPRRSGTRSASCLGWPPSGSRPSMSPRH